MSSVGLGIFINGIAAIEVPTLDGRTKTHNLNRSIKVNINSNGHRFSYIPLRPKTKKPVEVGWQNRSVQFDALGAIPDDINVGVLTGTPSGGLVDIDLDGPRTIEAGALILPFTGMITGRDSRPSSHWFYLIEGSAKSVTLKHPATGQTLIEFRGDGCQTMMPPSIHPDDGETVRFETGKDGEPASCDRETLLIAIRHIATLSVLGEFSIEGGRHNLARQFAGLCACNTWSAMGATVKIYKSTDQ